MLMITTVSVTVSIPRCRTYGDCESCNNNNNNKAKTGYNCVWCPLDRTCYESATKSHCLRDQTITDSTMCQVKVDGNYSQQAGFLYTFMSAAAYADDPQSCLKKIQPKSDFQIKETITRHCEDLPLFKYSKCLAYTAFSKSLRVILLAFRGTQVDNPQIYDEVLSVLTKPKTSFEAGGKVQSYFANAYEKLKHDVNVSIVNLIRTYPNYDVVVTGHSLGGALASLAAMSLVYHKIVPMNRMLLYTYGLPRVGDKEYASKHDKLVNNSWRIVHHRDIVAHVPLYNLGIDVPYHHGTEIFYPEETMNQESKYQVCSRDEDMTCSDGLVTRKPCIFDLSKCIDDHKHYFGVRVGTICFNA